MNLQKLMTLAINKYKNLCNANVWQAKTSKGCVNQFTQHRTQQTQQWKPEAGVDNFQ